MTSDREMECICIVMGRNTRDSGRRMSVMDSEDSSTRMAKLSTKASGRRTSSRGKYVRPLLTSARQGLLDFLSGKRPPSPPWTRTPLLYDSTSEGGTITPKPREQSRSDAPHLSMGHGLIMEGRNSTISSNKGFWSTLFCGGCKP